MLHLLLLLFVIGALVDNVHQSLISCSTADNYSNGSQYHKNLYRLLQTITTATAENGSFYNGTLGVGADQIFALAMCYATPRSNIPRTCANIVVPHLRP
uniref:Gnk2-homologous domain-containing protein n=1 Tax=Aegilops tauschii subsp. strangulata TaxID=200361 RepID=A0A453JQ01_AEGTS